MEKHYLWGTHFYWLYNIKIMYRTMHYTGPIHILQRWYQELLAYHSSCIHRTHLMMADVKYLSRIHDQLIRSHGLIVNQLSLTNILLQPGAYSTDVLTEILQHGTYSVKLSDACGYQHQCSSAATLHIKKKAKTITTNESQPRCSSPVRIFTSTNGYFERKWS